MVRLLIWNIVLHLGEERRQWITYLRNVLFVILSHNFMVNPCKAGFGPNKIEKIRFNPTCNDKKA